MKEFAKNYLNVDAQPWQIYMAHRLDNSAENAGIIVVFSCFFTRDKWVQGSIDNAPALKQRKMSVVTDLPPTLRTVRSKLLEMRREKLYTSKEWVKARVKQLPRYPFLQLVVQEAVPDGAPRCHRVIDHDKSAKELAAFSRRLRTRTRSRGPRKESATIVATRPKGGMSGNHFHDLDSFPRCRANRINISLSYSSRKC